MAIDRIGKGGGLPPTPEAQGPTGAAGAAPTGAKFEVERTDPANAPAQVGNIDVTPTAAATPLARLRAGEIDLNGYVDLKVDEATHALHGLSAAELGDIKSMLRDQMRTDPGLAELVHAATGKMPTPPED